MKQPSYTPEDHQVIQSLNDLNGSGASTLGLIRGLEADIRSIPLLVRSFIRSRLRGSNGETQQEKPSDVVIIPGFRATNGHLSILARSLTMSTSGHEHFDQILRRRTVLEDANAIASDISRIDRPRSICSHSRGGLVALCLLRMLEEQGLDHLIHKMTLLSPTSHGVRPEIARIARIIPIASIQDLCPGSDAIKFWQALSPESRAKVRVVSQEGGDFFTAPEQSFVKGGTMTITPPCGHQESVRDRNTVFFQIAQQLLQAG